MLEKITDNLHVPYGIRDVQLLASGITFFLLLWLHQHAVIAKMFTLQQEVGATAGLVTTAAAAYVIGRILISVGDAITNIGFLVIQILQRPMAEVTAQMRRWFIDFPTLHETRTLPSARMLQNEITSADVSEYRDRHPGAQAEYERHTLIASFSRIALGICGINAVLINYYYLLPAVFFLWETLNDIKQSIELQTEHAKGIIGEREREREHHRQVGTTS